MKKITVYFPEDLKARLARVAAAEERSESDIIREAVAASLDERERRPRPTLPLFSSGQGDLADRVDEILREGFGED
ncbi:MAG: ribbon-helix-helix domain-containing protein [Actinomycetota bacterium]